MRVLFQSVVSAIYFAILTRAINILLTNDDGWAEVNQRTMYAVLNASGHKVILSAPATDKSGSSSMDQNPTTVNNGCQHHSCPPGSPPTGFDPENPRFNYVNSFPVTAMKFGVQELAAKKFKEPTDLVVAGPNVGINVGLVAWFSGTVGAASAAADQFKIPAIAFSGASGKNTAWNATSTPEPYVKIYTDLANKLVQTLVSGGESTGGSKILPPNTFLNVNFPPVSAKCSSVESFTFVLTRLLTAIPIATGKDFAACPGQGDYLPEEYTFPNDACKATVSVARADQKMDAGAREQEEVHAKLKSILTCPGQNAGSSGRLTGMLDSIWNSVKQGMQSIGLT